MKKVFKILGIILCLVAFIILTAVIYLFVVYKPSLKADFSKPTGNVTTGASGFLYGLAEPDIPSVQAVESIGISTLAAKTFGGLQHPIGDISHVYDTFNNAGGKYLMVYTQDMYSTWYYQLDSLPEYYEKIKTTVSKIENAKFEKEVVYCVFNESDNGVWFGDFSVKENRFKFYDAFKEASEIVKALNPNARIAGPGYCGYNEEFIEEFLTYCKENDCVPGVFVWHELSDKSLYQWDEHFDSYYNILEKLSIDKSSVEINISEYGLMRTNGIPGESIKWISRIEKSKVEACVAYWRLADNLCDVLADDITPNGNYWVYRWYSELCGQTVEVTDSDIFQSNVENYIKGKENLNSKGLSGVFTIDSANKCASAVVGGTSDEFNITFDKLNLTDVFKDVKSVLVTVYSTEFKGLGGEVVSPVLERMYNAELKGGKIKVEFEKSTATKAYLITVTPYESDIPVDTKNENKTSRYEAEDAVLSGNAKSFDTAYAYSGSGMVGFIDAENDSVEFTVDIEQDGAYQFDIVYGNGYKDENGERVDATHTLYVDGENFGFVKYPSTIKYEHTSCASITIDSLKKGKHTIKLAHEINSATVDFIDVTRIDKSYVNEYIYSQKDNTKSSNSSTAFLLSAPSDGEYDIRLSFKLGAHIENADIILNNVRLGTVTSAINGGSSVNPELSNETVYLHRGINIIEVASPDLDYIFCSEAKSGSSLKYDAKAFALSGNAVLSDNSITGICSSKASSASLKVNSSESGVYALTFNYSNNEEGGIHDYNVDLVERYITLFVNGQKTENVFFRNTYSWQTFKTRTVYVSLNKGENEILLTNDGSLNFDGRETFAPVIESVTVAKAF